MSIPVSSRALVVLILALLLLGPGNSTPATARVGEAPSALAAVGPLADAATAPSARFAFGSVLGQLATSIQKVAVSVDGTPVANPNNVQVRPGQLVVYRISGQIQSASAPDVADIFDSGLTYYFDTGNCFPAD